MTKLSKALGRMALALTGGAAVTDLLARLNVRRERARRAYLGDRLYTEIRGAGDPIVFLPGYQGSTAFWGDAFDPLADRHRLILLDPLGFGRSPWPEIEYTLEDHLGAIRRTLTAAGATDRVTLVAHSFGTVLAAWYAARHPDEIERLFLLGTPVFDSEDDARDRIHEISPVAALFALHPFLGWISCTLMCAYRPLLEKVLPAFKGDLPAQVVSDAVLHSWPAANGSLRNVLLACPIAEPLAKIGPKVTFVHGTRDGITPMPRVRELAAAIGARVIETPDHHLSYVARSAGRIQDAIAHHSA